MLEENTITFVRRTLKAILSLKFWLIPEDTEHDFAYLLVMVQQVGDCIVNDQGVILAFSIATSSFIVSMSSG